MRHLMADANWRNDCVISTCSGMLVFLPTEGELLDDWMQPAEEYPVPVKFAAAIDALGQT
jgi:hypothetical protein